jgi:predicted transglutaminase-like cysteine proteinase
MLRSRIFLRPWVAFLLVLLALPVTAGIVDFSAGLLAYASNRFGSEAQPRLLVWQRLIRDSRSGQSYGSPIESLMRRVNGFFNQVPYVDDMSHWGIADYWATPVEMLGSFGGDCEDYSIAKYLSLKDLGIPLDRLRITYVRATSIGESHMVLAYYPNPESEPLILDNLIGDIRPASQRPDLVPVYSFNDDDMWLPAGAPRKGGASQVRIWRDLLEKLAREQRM